jgi:SRSO17 transposase
MSNQGGSLYTAALDQARTVWTGAIQRARAHTEIGRTPTRLGGRRCAREIAGRVAAGARGGGRAGAGACGRDRERRAASKCWRGRMLARARTRDQVRARSNARDRYGRDRTGEIDMGAIERARSIWPAPRTEKKYP